MKQKIWRMHLIALLSGYGFLTIINATDVRIRSQSVDTARELSGWTNHVNLYDMDGFYGTFAVTPEYTRSFRDCQIARSLFGNAILNSCKNDSSNDCNTCSNDCNLNCFSPCGTACNNDYAYFRVSGSQSPNRKAGDLLADYFGLPLDYQSTVYVKPVIQNFLVDFDLFLGLDGWLGLEDWLCGLWFRIHAPVVWAKWNLCLNEKITQPGTIGYPAGYFAPADVPVSDLNTSFKSYLAGNVPTLNGNVVFQPLANQIVPGNATTSPNGNCSKKCKNDTVKLSDIRFALGWNFWEDEDYHVGAGILAAAPTGTRVDDRLLFQPFVGNGHHWELGAKFTSHYTFWRSCDYDKSLGFFFDLDITHMFETKQRRVFDLCSRGDCSRYMLAEAMTTPAIDNLEGGGTASTYQFNNVFTPVANIAVNDFKVSQDVQVDLTAMFNFTSCGFCWDIGYNFWYTGCERLKECGCTPPLFRNNTTYALKGDAYVIGFDSVNADGPVRLGATEDNATICTGTNYPVGTTIPSPSFNASIDNPQLATGDSTNSGASNVLVAGPGLAQTHTSIQSVFLANDDIDYADQRCKGLSNKIFTHLSYTWEDRACWVPYLGAGIKGEWAGNHQDCSKAPCTNSSGCCESFNSPACCNTNCNNDRNCDSDRKNSKCRITNISEWGIWIKGGVSFN